MAKITTFEELHCWQNAKALVSKMYRDEALNALHDWSTRDQFRRAGLSVMNNIAEGFTRFSTKERIRFFEIAQSSAAEVKSMLYLFEEIGYISSISIADYQSKVDLTRNQILAFIRHLNQLSRDV
ncbi:MAG: four helix bundle protein [Saprospiraceae bacterium]